LAFWLVVGEKLPTESNATGIYEAILDLRDAMSAVGVTVVLSAAAYLVGAVSDFARRSLA